MGISGVIVKPMIGLLDAASKTAEGFKNMAQINNEGLLSIKERVPRAFYGKQMMFKPYIPYDAEIMFILTKTHEIDVSKFSYVDAYPMKSSRDAAVILNLVIFEEGVGLFSYKTDKFVWVTTYEMIETVEKYDLFIRFTFKEEIPKINVSVWIC